MRIGWRYSIGVVLASAVFIAVALGCWHWYWAGYSLPGVEDVVGMKARLCYAMPVTAQFEVPEQRWGEVLASLAPSRYDARGMKWDMLGDLEIETKQGKRYNIDLYMPGAFRVGDRYYIGGNGERLLNVLQCARAASTTRQMQRPVREK